MANRDHLIEALHAAVEKRHGTDESLILPEWDTVTWKKVLERADVRDLDKGEILIERDEAGRDLYFLVTGKLEVSVPNAGSQSMSPLVTIHPGSVVGEIAFLDSNARSASVWAQQPATLFRMDRKAFDSFRREHPDLACDLLLAIGGILAQRIRSSQNPKGARKSLFSY